MMNSRFWISVLVIFLFYSFPEYLFSNAMLYLTGGAFGGLIKGVLKVFVVNPSYNLIYTLWIFVLILFTVLFIYIKNISLRFSILFLIGLLLYVFDLILFSIIDNEKIKYLNIFLITVSSIVFKTMILSLILYFDLRRLNGTNN